MARIARLQVTIGNKVAFIRTSNVFAFSRKNRADIFESLVVNGAPVPSFKSEEVEGRFVLDRGTSFAVSVE